MPTSTPRWPPPSRSACRRTCWRRSAGTAGRSSPTDETGRAFAVLAGNVLAVAHEQQRLQVDVVDAMDAGPVTHRRVMPRWTAAPARTVVAQWPPASRSPRVRRRSVWGGTMTELLMTLRVPGAVLRLAHDLPPLPDGQRFPHRPGRAPRRPRGARRGRRVFGAWDRTAGTGRTRAPTTGPCSRTRMNYIVNLFRGRQQDPSLRPRPFNAGQLAAMQAARMPDGPLLPSAPGRRRPPACRHVDGARRVGDRRTAPVRRGGRTAAARRGTSARRGR